MVRRRNLIRVKLPKMSSCKPRQGSGRLHNTVGTLKTNHFHHFLTMKMSMGYKTSQTQTFQLQTRKKTNKPWASKNHCQSSSIESKGVRPATRLSRAIAVATWITLAECATPPQFADKARRTPRLGATWAQLLKLQKICQPESPKCSSKR